VIDKRYGNGGWSVDILDVIEYDDKILVKYTNLNKGDDTLPIIQPYHFVKIPISNKNVVFEYIE
jgi:hypothetical protein